MSASRLVVLPTANEPESPADHIRRLQTEARGLAREQMEMLAEALTEVSRLSADIADGGDIYPVGARELAKRLIEESSKQALALTAIIERA